MRETLSFLKQWAKAPLQTAAIAPSGSSLARLMTEDMGPKSGPVIELGPGTGVFTHAMLDRGLPEDQLALIELNPNFAKAMADTFPRAQVHCMSAAELESVQFFDTAPQRVISGLGLLSMPDEVVEAILRGVFHHLAPGGAFVQFTYGPKCPVPPAVMDKLGLKGRRIGGTLRNLPPASVYHVTRA